MKIFPKLLITYLVLCLLPLFTITFFSYIRWSDIAKKNQLDALTEIMQSRTYYIERYFSNMEKRARLMSRTEEIANFIEELKKAVDEYGINTKGYWELATQEDAFVDYFSYLYNIGDVYMIDPDGKILYTFEKKGDLGQNVDGEKLKNSGIAEAFHEALTTTGVALSQFAIYPISGKPEVFVASPIVKEGQVLGVFAFQIPSTEIYKIFEDYTFLGATGEVLIGTKSGNDILFVNSIRHKPGAAFNFKIPLGSNIALPMQNAVQQRSGKGVSIDYRGKEILAVWKYFPKMKWGVVVKIDLEEALLPIDYLRNLLLLVGFGTAIVVIIVVIGIAKLLSKPIVELERAVKLVGAGNLDVTIDVHSKDELGDLANDLNHMISHLKESTISVERLNLEIDERKREESRRTELLSRISHELRTPIAPIKESIGLVLKEHLGPVTEEQRDLLNLAQENVERLLNLVTEILTVQEVQSERVIFDFIEGNLNEIVEQELKKYEENIARKGLQLHLELAQDLAHVSFDREAIRKAVDHLISNAVKFTEKGDIWISTRNEAHHIRFEVRDSGSGMSEEDCAKLFQGFRELSIKSLEKTQGAGIGLVVSEKIVNAHNGRMGAQSKLGEGSTFYFTLPIKKG